MLFSCCLTPPEEREPYDMDEEIPGLWYRRIPDSGHHYGQFSTGVLRGNMVIEDYTQVEVDHDGVVFCGIYHGHGGGTRASRFVAENLYGNFRRRVQETENISEDVFLTAFNQTEDDFLHNVESEFSIDNQEIASHGSSCLVGVLAGRMLHYANLGDSRAVLGYLDFCGNIQVTQLTQDHNLNDDKARREYQALHPSNHDLLEEVDGIWHIKGIVKVTRCIGDGNLKSDNLAIQDGEFHIPGQPQRPLVSAIPSVQAKELRWADKFVIFACNALWELLTNLEAARVVHDGPRQGAAKRLIQEALRRRDENAVVRYDISVIVLFVDIGWDMWTMPAISMRSIDGEDSPSGFDDEIIPSGFDDEIIPSGFDDEIIPSGFDDEIIPSDSNDEIIPSDPDDEIIPADSDDEEN